MGKVAEQEKTIVITEQERNALPKVFTSLNKDFITIDDLMKTSGLSYGQCAKMIREIQAVSNIFNISGVVHRTDYFIFQSKRFSIMQEAMNANGTLKF